MIVTCCALLAPLSFLIDAASQSIDTVSIAPDVVLEDRYPERGYEFPNGVNSLADVVYAVHAGYRPLILDLYLPPGAGTNGAAHPLVVMVHGGGWQGGHTRHSGAFADWPAALASIASEGFAVASVEYRLSAEAPFPAAFDDVRDAIRWLRAHAREYGIDGTKAVVMGGSAGGQLAGLVGTACGNNTYPDTGETRGHGTQSACVQGVVAWYGVFDFNGLVPVSRGPEADQSVQPVLARYLDCGPSHCEVDKVRAASAISWVDSEDPPFLLIHGTDDPVVDVGQSRKMHQALMEAGVRSTLVEIPGVSHSFIGDTPDATVGASRRAWDESVAFIRLVLAD